MQTECMRMLLEAFGVRPAGNPAHPVPDYPSRDDLVPKPIPSRSRIGGQGVPGTILDHIYLFLSLPFSAFMSALRGGGRRPSFT